MKWTRRQALVASGGAAVTGLASPVFATPPNKPDDASIALRLLSRYHPGLWRYQSSTGWAQAADAFARAFRAAPDLGGQYLALTRLTAAIRCGHTYCNPYNQPDTIDRLMAGARLLPFRFDWLGAQMVVTADPHGTGLAAGTEVLAIDGIAAADRLADLLPLARADGSLDNKRRALLSVTGAKYELFDMIAAARGSFGETIALDVRAPGGAISSLRVPTIDVAARRAAVAETPEEDDTPLWRARMEGRTAILTMPTWAVFNSRWDWQSWLEAHLTDWAGGGADALVIDLRGNEGGLTAPGDVLLAHLAGSPIAPPPVRQLYRVGSVAPEDREFLETYDDSLYEAGRLGRDLGNGWFALPPEASEPVAPRAPRFAGKVAVLVDASNSSATGSFAETVKREGLALLVGQPTGKNRRGLNGSAYFFARLPQSGLEFDIPLVAGVPDGMPPDASIAPDLPVESTPESIAHDGDRALAAALAALG